MSLNSYLGSPRIMPPGKTLCYVSGKLRNDTQEERVRQRISRSLIAEYIYKKSELAVNFSIKIGTKRHPVDIAVFYEQKHHVQENIYIIVETKKETITPMDRNEGVDQLKSYMSASLNCQYGMWTNGVDKLCFQKVKDKGLVRFEDIIDIPIKGKSLDEYEKVSFDVLRPAFELQSAFKRSHNYIYANQGLQKTEAFHEFLKIIFCKVHDEKGKDLKFYATSQEINSQLGARRVKERIDGLFEEVKSHIRYKHIFKKVEEKIELEPNVLAYIVSQIQHYSFLQTDTDVKGDAYEEIVGANLRGDRGEFFTPRNVCKLAVESVFNIYREDHWDKLDVLDPACGTGGFLIAIINFIKEYFFKREIAKWHDEEKTLNILEEFIREYCEGHLHGIDFNPLLARAAQMNEVMHGNGSGNLLSCNSLDHPNHWRDDVNEKIKLGRFDIVFTNPPFGSKIPIRDPVMLAQYDLGYMWNNKTLEKKDKLASSAPPEELFVERCIQFLKPKGKLAIVLPDSILSNPGKKYIRYWILKNTRVIASIDLPRETFLPNVGTKTSILILQKKTPEEIKLEEDNDKMIDYEVFMSMPKYVGHDRRGNPLYKRTPEGEEILETKEREVIRIVNKTKVKEREKVLEPVKYDELPEVAKAFKDWIRSKG